MAAAGSCSTGRRGASETLLGVTQTSAKMKNWVEFGFDTVWESMRSSWALDWGQQDANPSALVPQHYNALQSWGSTFQSSKRWKFPYPGQWVRTGSLCPLCPVSRSSSLVYDYNLLKRKFGDTQIALCYILQAKQPTSNLSIICFMWTALLSNMACFKIIVLPAGWGLC